MRLILAAVLALMTVGASAVETANVLTYQTLRDNLGNRVSVFGEKGSYALTNIFSLQSTFGTSVLRDIETTTGTGAIGLDGGYIELKTGTTTGSTAKLETVNRGQYQPGKGAEAGIAAYMVTPPDSGTELAEWGLGDGDNGIFWRYHNNGGSFELCVVYERSSTEDETCEGDFTDGLGDFDPVDDAAIWIVRFNWYGVGGAEYWVYYADATEIGTLKEQLVHRFAPDTGQAMDDPNLPVYARVTNGDGTTDVEIEVGGRRYDIQGEFDPPIRRSFERRTGQTVGTSYVPLVCARREDPFPEAGRQNSVNAFIDALTLTVASEDVMVAYATVDASNLTDASFADPTDFADSETALEYDTSATAISDFTILTGGYMFPAGVTTGPGDEDILTELKKRIPLVSTDPTCAIAKVAANTATVDTTLRVAEEW